MGSLKRRIIEDLEPTEYELARRWIPVDERLPEKEQEVLAYWPSSGLDPDVPWMTVARINEDGNWADIEMELEAPTHWMPLPEPPAR